MKILIDEQLTTKLKYRFIEANFEVHTVRDMNWQGTKNGELLRLMTDNHFNVLPTNDKNLYYQQKVESLKICIVNVNAKTNRYDDVFELMDVIISKLKEVEVFLTTSTGGYFIV
jgi:predicted nuclease of predicted toxin-antitoxin system